MSVNLTTLQAIHKHIYNFILTSSISQLEFTAVSSTFWLNSYQVSLNYQGQHLHMQMYFKKTLKSILYI